jgi:hypothetical protein
MNAAATHEWATKARAAADSAKLVLVHGKVEPQASNASPVRQFTGCFSINLSCRLQRLRCDGCIVPVCLRSGICGCVTSGLAFVVGVGDSGSGSALGRCLTALSTRYHYSTSLFLTLSFSQRYLSLDSATDTAAALALAWASAIDACSHNAGDSVGVSGQVDPCVAVFNRSNASSSCGRLHQHRMRADDIFNTRLC